MGSVGDAYDNALAESFFASLECEVLDRNHFRTREEARTAVFSWIEGWYNPHRRHSSLGYLSPKQFEQELSTNLESPSSELLTHSRQTARRVRSMKKPESKAENPKRRRSSTDQIIH
jgi:putative transposase